MNRRKNESNGFDNVRKYVSKKIFWIIMQMLITMIMTILLMKVMNDMYNNDAFRNNSEDMRDSKRTKKTICEGRVKCTQENIKHPLQNKGTPPKKRKKKKKSKSNHKFVVFQK